MPRFLQYLVNMFYGLPHFIQIVITLAFVAIFLKTYINMIKVGYKNDVKGSIILPVIAVSFASSFNPIIYITVWIALYYAVLYRVGLYNVVVEKITIFSSFIVVPLIVREIYNTLYFLGVINFIKYFFEFV